MTVEKKRRQLTVNLGEFHDAFLELAAKYAVKPATLAAYFNLSVPIYKIHCSSQPQNLGMIRKISRLVCYKNVLRLNRLQ